MKKCVHCSAPIYYSAESARWLCGAEEIPAYRPCSHLPESTIGEVGVTYRLLNTGYWTHLRPYTDHFGIGRSYASEVHLRTVNGPLDVTNYHHPTSLGSMAHTFSTLRCGTWHIPEMWLVRDSVDGEGEAVERLREAASTYDIPRIGTGSIPMIVAQAVSNLPTPLVDQFHNWGWLELYAVLLNKQRVAGRTR